MALTKLGMYIEAVDERNSNGVLNESSVVGLSTQKDIIKTKADLSGVNLTSYKFFPPKTFAYVPDTSRRGDKISLAYNVTSDTYLVSSISVVFKVVKSDALLSDYLFMYFNRPEFDRYARFNSWGSARETFSWEEMCDIDIEIPSREIQQKYVNIYNAMLANQRSYECGLDDLKMAIELIIDKFKHDTQKEFLGDLIVESDIRNENVAITDVFGVNKEKQFMPSVASGANLKKYKVVRNGQFACNLMHVGRDVAIPIALHDIDKSLIVSPAYLVFNVKVSNVLPEYLLMWLSRSETDRYAWFMSDTNVRSGMEKNRFYEIKIPVPNMKEQLSLVNIYNAYVLRREINEQLKVQVRDICPILIKGAIEEGK